MTAKPTPITGYRYSADTLTQNILKEEKQMASNGKSPGILLRNAGIFNPVLVQAVGLCPVVAMATSVKSALLLSVVAAAIITLSELIASLFLKPVPRWVRIGIYIIIGGAMVAPAMILIERLNAPLFGELGIYLPIMAVNSLIVLRCERFAVKIRPVSALLDGLTASVGYTAVLILTGLVREILGSGSLLGFRFFKGNTLSGLLLPFGGFIMLGFFGAVLRTLIAKFWPKYLDKKQPKPGAKKKAHHKPEDKPQTQHKAEPSVREVPVFTADEAMFTLDDIAEKHEEQAVRTASDAEEATVVEPEIIQTATEETPEVNKAESNENPAVSNEQISETNTEKDGFRELTIEDLDSQPSADMAYSGSDDELEALMNRSIGDILSKQKKEESDE